MLLFFKNVRLRNLFMKQFQTHASSLQINYEIFITYSLCIHVLFELFMINSLGKIMGSHLRCQYVLELVGKFWTLSGLMGSI